ncbi:site-specific integrase [Streptomyces sp. PCS3-D2]|uniref:tyrosine-type recombinase/integrase n=1 Tax=Streptomyces sp. PCS3-D2 TaxID=1460244 RepID=UPI0004533907|nr:site-specific integrase [Streptomyces sp. PCS3-D2]WKV74260.1 site-specific integrase [Streptomyces sp. PCS3-D2]
MARRATNNPRQLREQGCGCKLCQEKYPPAKYGERRARRDCIGSWQARYRDPDGKQCGPVFPTQREASAHLDKVRTQIREGTYQDPKRGAITVDEWYEIWWPTVKVKSVTTGNRKLSAWTVHVQPKWGARKLNSITWIQVQDWITNEVKGHATQKKVLELLRHMMVAALRDRRISLNPCLDIEVSPAPAKHPDDLIPPTAAQAALIREHLTAYYHPLVVFAEETGMRWGEYTGLRACNVDLERCTVKVKEVLVDDKGKIRRKMAPKSRAGFRTVPLTPAAVEAVRVMMDRHRPAMTESSIEDGMHAEELIFRGPLAGQARKGKDGVAVDLDGVLTRPNFRRHWIPAIKAAGLARIVKNPETGRHEFWPRVHDLRHTFATRLKDAGVPEKDVQVIMGHERGGRVTWLYQHAGPQLVEEVRSALVTGRHLRAVG